MTSIIERDALVGNLLDELEQMEARLRALERAAATGLFEGTTLVLPGEASLPELPTAGLAVVDAGSAGATEQAWVEVQVGGATGYLRVYAAK
jgi:hypothetical protein